MHLRSSALVVLVLFSITNGAVAQPITGRELIRRLQAAPMEAIVQYCNKHAPEADQLLTAGFAAFTSNLRTAMDMWIAEKPDKQASLDQEIQLDSPQAVEALATLEGVGVKIADSVKQYDPKKYCPWLATRLSSTKPELLLVSLHQYDARVAAMIQKEMR